MNRIFIFIFLTNLSYLSFSNNDYLIALNKLKEANDFFEKNVLNNEQIKQVRIVIENISQKIDFYKSEHYISENGVLPLPEPISEAETQLKPQNDLLLTPNSKDKQNCIYTHIAQIGIEIPLDERIDFKEVYKNVTNKIFHWKRKISEQELFQIAAIIEKKLMTIIFDKSNLLKAVKYVGLAEGMQHRFYGHYSDIYNEQKKIQNKKAKCHNQTLKQSNIQMSYLINNIPIKYLKNFEALVSTVFPVQLYHASAVIADESAWNFIIKYKNSNERKKHVTKEDISKLSNLVDYMGKYFNSIDLNSIEKVKLKVKRKLDFSPEETPPNKKTSLQSI